MFLKISCKTLLLSKKIKCQAQFARKNNLCFTTPFTRYRYKTLPVKNHYVFNYSHGTGRVVFVTTFVHFIIEIRTLKCFA